MYVILIAIMIFVAVSLSGLFAPPFPKGQTVQYTPPGYTCCDTGDDADCRAQPEVQTINYKGETYALLKSDMYMHQYNKELTTEHLLQSRNPSHLGPRNERIFLNPAEKRGGVHLPECDTKNGSKEGNDGYDRLYGKPDPRNVDNPTGPGCYSIPDELLIYLCRSDSPGNCDARTVERDEVKFDTYIRMADIQQGGRLGKIPDTITNCYKPPIPTSGEKQILFRPSPGGQKNLQLRTFKFTEDKPPVTWLSPYCKPAIYLYPERKTEVNVSVFPQGKMLLTIPPYPKNGWDVVADPNGDIYHQNIRFDYLYYEAAIPDQLIQKPEKGFIMSYDERALFLTNLVTKLGLNKKETQQFIEYWVPILPKSPYYFVGVVSQTTLHEISPVFITPRPNNLIRITLYFQALDTKEPVSPPIFLPVQRDGFTVVEWGGIFKQDKDHPFSCFM